MTSTVYTIIAFVFCVILFVFGLYKYIIPDIKKNREDISHIGVIIGYLMLCAAAGGFWPIIIIALIVYIGVLKLTKKEAK